jgi:hypothetical protein
MTEQEIIDLIGQTALSFTGTVESVAAATMRDIPVDDRTVVVQVDQVLHAPEALARLAGKRVTVQVAPDAEVPTPGESAAFFTNPTVFGESLAVNEVASLPTSEIAPYIATAAAAGTGGPFEMQQQALADQRLRDHAQQADAVVIARVAKLEKAGPAHISEHDPDWWRATLDIAHAERGDDLGDQVEVLYANSLDVRWRRSPKPKASQEGLWLLHSTEGDLRKEAPFQITHPEDYQPVTRLEQLRAEG